MTKKRETRRQQRVRELLQREVGGYWRKIWGGPFQQAGIADILGCCEGLFFAFEVKEPDGTPSELQLDEIEEVNAAGGVSAIIIEPVDAVRLVRRAIRRANSRILIPYRKSKRPSRVRTSKRSRHR